MENFIRFCVQQRVLVFLAVFALIAGGIFAAQNVAIDAVPDVTNVQVQVLTASPALAPLEVERRITFPIETAMAGLPGIENVRSLSKFGLSAVTIVFHEGTDLYFARQLVFERLAEARSEIPQEIGSPELGPISTGLGEIYQYRISAKPGSKYDVMALRTIQDWDVRRRLLGVSGLAEVNSFGGEQKQYQVRIDPIKLRAYNLTIRDVLDAVTRNNQNVGGGYVEHGGEQYLLRGIGLVGSADDISRIVLKTGESGNAVLVRDVADVVTAPALRRGAVTADGQGEIVTGIALMLQGANARDVVSRVKERLADVARSLPAGVKITPFYDRTELVNRTVATVSRNLTEGAILVALVLLALLLSPRGALAVVSLIPLAMLFAAVCMASFNVSGNLMSLGALDFGLIVDGAVFMVEAAIRRRAAIVREKINESVEESVIAACSEVARPVVFAMIIVSIVYIPILSLTGIEGKMFRPMALTVLFALIGALILTLTYIPALLSILLRGNIKDRLSPVIRFARKAYTCSLPTVYRYDKTMIAAAGMLVIASIVVLTKLGSEFIPRLGEGSVAVQLQQAPSVSLARALQTVNSAERVLRSFPEVTGVVSKTGSAEVATDPMGVDATDMLVNLKPPEEWEIKGTQADLVVRIAKALDEQLPTASFSFSQPIELRVSELISGVRSDIAVKIFGDDLDALRKSANEIARVLGTVPGAQDVKVEQTAGLPELRIAVNREAVARYGISVEDVNGIVASLVAGEKTGEVVEGERRFDLVVRLAGNATRDVQAIRDLIVPTPNGLRVPLSALASIDVRQGPAQISREDGRRRIVVEMNVRGRDIGSFVAEARTRIASDVKLPAGYYATWGGQFENLQRATARLTLVVPIALLLIFVLLFTTFGSLRQAWIVFSGIPLAIIGGVIGLAIRQMPFSISAGIGFIALSGVAVLNGVVLISAINAKRRSGLALREAIDKAASAELRPILTTALVASVGLVPMALAHAAGAEVQRPLATVVIGGLISATLLGLYVLPILQQWFGIPARMLATETPATSPANTAISDHQ